MLDDLRNQVLEANLLLPKYNLITFTWGNASGIDPETRLVVIKPSGVSYDRLTAQDLVVMDLDGRIVEGTLNPSSDAVTHLELYKHSPAIGGIVHTHSMWATAWAQAGRAIPALGTTHADTFYGPVPCTRTMTDDEILGHYEYETGKVITETLTNEDDLAVPAVLVHSHGPFCWGSTALQAAHHAVILEEVAKIAYHTLAINPNSPPVEEQLLRRHYLRKHGVNAYYGQKP